jgi:hypothetical protein
MGDLDKGLALLRELPPAVTFFGGARITEDDPFYEQSKTLGRMLRQAGIPPRTGAGPGIMTSVPEGYKAEEKDKRCKTGAFVKAIVEGYAAGNPAAEIPLTQGIKIFLPFEPDTNEAIDRSVELVTFPIRRLMLYENSLALVVFPGGIGTLDELFEVWARRLSGRHNDPIVLYGSSFFGPIMDALRHVLLDGSRDLIDRENFEAVEVSDDPQAIVDSIANAEGLVGFDESPEVIADRLLIEIPYVAGALQLAARATTVLGGATIPANDPTVDVARGIIERLAKGSAVRVGACGTVANAALSAFKAQGRVGDLQGFFLKANTQSLSDLWADATRLEVTDPLAHKLLLTENSSGFLVLPGTIQTLDEVFSVLCEMQTGKRARVPLVLIGSDYWNPIIEACEQVMLSKERQTISPEDFGHVTVVDDVETGLRALAS